MVGNKIHCLGRELYKIKAFYSWGLVDLKDLVQMDQYIYIIFIYAQKKEMEIEMDGYAWCLRQKRIGEKINKKNKKQINQLAYKAFV